MHRILDDSILSSFLQIIQPLFNFYLLFGETTKIQQRKSTIRPTRALAECARLSFDSSLRERKWRVCCLLQKEWCPGLQVPQMWHVFHQCMSQCFCNTEMLIYNQRKRREIQNHVQTINCKAVRASASRIFWGKVRKVLF